jgi:hypothetical protein
MKKIFVRSPYYITIAETGQVGSKVELRFRYYGGTFPTPANYILSKKIPSPTQIETIYNVSNYAKSFIKAVAPNLTTGVEANNAYCFMEVKRYNETSLGVFNLLTTETFCCLNGYSLYSDGVNKNTTASVVPLFNTNINLQRTGTIALNFFLDTGTYIFNEVSFTTTEPSVYSLTTNSNTNLLDAIAFNTPLVCEPKYTPKIVYFINRFGGWQSLTFFKVSKESYQTKSEKFKTFPAQLSYDIKQGQSKKYNNNGQKSIMLNTGWVDENYTELIEDLLLSERVLMDNKPMMVKTESQQVKTRLIDKTINYEIELMYNNEMINDV